MKNINKFFAGIGVLAALVSCDGLNTTPEFQEKDSFAAFSKTTFNVDENVGKISIPVSIASINPIKTNVTYKVEDGSAKQGVNYKLTDPSAVLAFDGEAREMNIEIDVMELKGKFTGDLNFKVIIENAAGINLGEGVVCEVNIRDLDHPLAALLGNWTINAKDYFGGGAAISWGTEIMKDGKSVSSVKFKNFSKFLVSQIPNEDIALAANVVFDEKKEIVGLNMPIGQSLGFKLRGSDILLIGIEFDETGEPASFIEEGNIEFKLVEGKLVTEAGFGIFIDGNGWADIFMPGVVLTKK